MPSEADEAGAGEQLQHARALGQPGADRGGVDPEKSERHPQGKLDRRAELDPDIEHRSRRRHGQTLGQAARRAAEQHRGRIARRDVAAFQKAQGIAAEDALRHPFGQAGAYPHQRRRHRQPDRFTEPLCRTVGGEHLPVVQSFLAAELVHAARRAAALDQPGDDLGQLEDVDRLHALLSAPGQGDHRQAGKRGEEGGAFAAGAEHERRANDRGVDTGFDQRLVGEPLAAQVPGFVAALRLGDAERRNLHDAADTGEGGAAKQLDRAFGVDALEAGRGRGHQDADAIDDGVDAPGPQLCGPIAGRAALHEIEPHRVRARHRAPAAFDDAVAAPAQGAHDGPADAAVGTADQDVHDAFSLARRLRTASMVGPSTREIDLRWRAKTR